MWEYVSSGTAIVARGRIPGLVTQIPKWKVEPHLSTRRVLQSPGSVNLPTSILVDRWEYSWNLTYIALKRLSEPKYDWSHFFSQGLNSSASPGTDGAWSYSTSIGVAPREFAIFHQSVSDGGSGAQNHFRGCRVGRIGLSVSVDSPLEVTADGMATTSTTLIEGSWGLAHATTIASVGTPFLWSDCTLYIDGSLATNCVAFEGEIVWETEAKWKLGTLPRKNPSLLYTGAPTIQGRLSVWFDYQAADPAGWLDDTKDGTSHSITLRLNDSAAGDPRVAFRDAVFEQWDYPKGEVGSGRPLILELPWRAKGVGLNP